MSGWVREPKLERRNKGNLRAKYKGFEILEFQHLGFKSKEPFRRYDLECLCLNFLFKILLI